MRATDPPRPELEVIEADLLHLLSSWFNPGFMQMRQIDWNSPAQLLEKIIQHEAVHAIDGWNGLRRPQLPAAPLIDKASAPLAPERFRAAAFHSICNCETCPALPPGC